MTCPDCERNKYRAALWRAEAYKQAGHDVIERPWIGLTEEDKTKAWEWAQKSSKYGVTRIETFAHAIEAKLKDKNG